jgi:hypothetical protein
VRYIVLKRVTHKFTKGDVNPIESYDMMQLHTIQNFIVNFRRGEIYLTLGLLEDPIHASESGLSPATTTNMAA